MPPTQPRVVVVNDTPEFLELMGDLLRDASYPTVLIDGDRGDAVDLIEAAVPQLLIVDLRLGSDGLHGVNVLRGVRARPSLDGLPTIVCSADSWALEDLRADLEAMGGVRLLKKPFTIDELYRLIREALSRTDAPAAAAGDGAFRSEMPAADALSGEALPEGH